MFVVHPSLNPRALASPEGTRLGSDHDRGWILLLPVTIISFLLSLPKALNIWYL